MYTALNDLIFLSYGALLGTSGLLANKLQRLRLTIHMWQQPSCWLAQYRTVWGLLNLGLLNSASKIHLKSILRSGKI